MDKLYNKFIGASHTKQDDGGKWYVVGDIHGQLDLLMEELDEVEFDFSRDTLFALGDLVDRGSHSWDCLQLTYEPWFKSVLGNHEQIMWDGLWGQAHYWVQNGGSWWFEAGYDKLSSYREEARDIILSLPNYRTLYVGSKAVGIIHASAGGNVWPPKNTKLDTFGDPTTWDRTFLSGTVPKVGGVNLVIVGHNPTDRPVLQNNTIHIDTAYSTGRLSVLNVEDILNNYT